MSGKDPWYVQSRVSPEKVREWLATKKPMPMEGVDWDGLRERIRIGTLKIRPRGNTSLLCPVCSDRLFRFYVPNDARIIERSKTDSRLNRLISGYWCVLNCNRVYFAEELKA